MCVFACCCVDCPGVYHEGVMAIGMCFVSVHVELLTLLNLLYKMSYLVRSMQYKCCAIWWRRLSRVEVDGGIPSMDRGRSIICQR